MSKSLLGSKDNQPLFSIIVPVYNADMAYLDECIDSILKQTFTNIEIILVDDGSREECARACDGYAKTDNRIRVIHQDNKGVSAARNNGLKVSKAKWIMFVDADDWLEQDACEVLKSHLEEANCDILLFNAVKELPGKQLKLNYGFDNKTLLNNGDINIREMLYSRAMGSPNTKEGKKCVIYYSWDKVYSKEFLLKNEISYPEGIPKSEDKIFVLMCFEKLETLYYINNTLYHYRMNNESVSNRYSETADEERLNLVKRLNVIASQMDSELGIKLSDNNYHKIRDHFNRFTFGIISDVFKQKYYHKDYPRTRIERHKEIKSFLNQEPFRTSIRSISYTDLPKNARIKKFLLMHDLYTIFYWMKETNKSIGR